MACCFTLYLLFHHQAGGINIFYHALSPFILVMLTFDMYILIFLEIATVVQL